MSALTILLYVDFTRIMDFVYWFLNLSSYVFGLQQNEQG